MKYLKSCVVILLGFFLTPALAWGLGTGISYQTASMEGETRLITYNYGFNGKRVLHDDDGQASLIVLLTLMKQDYFRQGPAYSSPPAGETFKSWATYRGSVVANLTRLENYYNQHGLCSHEDPRIAGSCRNIKKLKTKLSQQSVQFSDIFELSGFLQNLKEIGLVHTYHVDRYDSEGKKLPNQEKAPADYMLETDNLHVWLPDQESSAKCRDYHASKGPRFVTQLGGGLAGQPGKSTRGNSRGAKANQ